MRCTPRIPSNVQERTARWGVLLLLSTVSCSLFRFLRSNRGKTYNRIRYMVIASPETASNRATQIANVDPNADLKSLRSIAAMYRRWRTTETMFTSTPNPIRPIPIGSENPVGKCWCVPAMVNSRRNSPKRATTKPNPMRAMPVRIQARNVRSAAM